ncbi:MAG: GNAT family N-acetyltransferase, partial [Sphaerochaetaceae bacterium]
LSFISKDFNKIADVLQTVFNPKNHFVVLHQENVVSVISFSDYKSNSLTIDKAKIISILGEVKGRVSVVKLNKALKDLTPLREGQCYIETVVTDSAYRGMGFSFDLQRHLFRTLNYKEYFLEVSELNFKAIRMYEKLGFAIIQQKKERSFWKPLNKDSKVIMSKKVVNDKKLPQESLKIDL